MHRIQLGNNVFEGRNNAYLLAGDGPTTLVDTGVALPDVRDDLESGLAAADHTFADIEQVLLTHWHADHVGLAGEIQAAGGATVRVHEADAPLVARDPEAMDALEAAQQDCYERWRMPDDARAELEAFLAGEEGLLGSAPDVEPFRDGDSFRAGDLTLDAATLPGHTAGLTAFVFERADGDETGDDGDGDGSRREAFVGDALLPKYTPNVGGADVRVERPLEQYLDSLDRVVDLELDRAWPGHRGSIFAPSARARDIVAHHHDRTRRTLRVLREDGPLSAWGVSDRLFGDLEGIHILHGPGEASSHLDFLVRAGVVERDGHDYVARDDAEVDVESLLADGRQAPELETD